MEYSENYEKNFADGGTRAPISDDEWELGWREIVGGVNGYPTSAQFNEVCGRLDRKINEIKKKKPDSDGEAKDLKVTFVEAQNRVNINSGESFSTIFGKIKKWFSDLGAAAFLKVAGNDTTNRSDTVPTTQVTYQHGQEIDQLGTKVSRINIYVGADKKLHFVNSEGVDTALPFETQKQISVVTSVRAAPLTATATTSINGTQVASVSCPTPGDESTHSNSTSTVVTV